jgi:hypothetical protein
MKGRKSKKWFWKQRTPESRHQRRIWNLDPGGFPRLEVPSFFAGNKTGKVKANGLSPLEQRKADFELDSGN